MLSLEADHFPSLRDGLHLWSLKNAFMQIAGTITGQSRVRSSDLGLIREWYVGEIQFLDFERRADSIRKTVRGLFRVRRWRRPASCGLRARCLHFSARAGGIGFKVLIEKAREFFRRRVVG